MKNIYLLLAAITLISCSDTYRAKSRIKKDLESRYTGFEIVEVRPDSSNIEQAINRCGSLQIRAAENNAKTIKLIAECYETTNVMKLKENYRQITILDSIITQDCKEFERLRFDRSEECFYVKYQVYKNEKKVPVEEYYLIKEKEVLHRPIDWTDFTYELEYDEVIDDVIKYHSEIFDLKFITFL